MERLSDKQLLVLTYIKKRLSTSYCPSIREIGQAVGISSTSMVKYHLDVLEKKGYICKEKKCSRTIRLA